MIQPLFLLFALVVGGLQLLLLGPRCGFRR